MRVCLLALAWMAAVVALAVAALVILLSALEEPGLRIRGMQVAQAGAEGSHMVVVVVVVLALPEAAHRRR